MSRLSLNQWTTRRWSVTEAVAGCVRHDIPAIGLWREHVAEEGLAKTAALVRDAGLRVSSLCRGGFFTRPGWRDDNRRAVDEAAGYTGDIEVEIFNADVWAADPDEVLTLMKRRYADLIVRSR